MHNFASIKIDYLLTEKEEREYEKSEVPKVWKCVSGG